MVIATLPELKEKLVVPAVSSNYPALGATYRHIGYEINYADRLVKTYKNSEDFIQELGIEGLRMSTAAEELAMQLNYEIVGSIAKRIEGKDIEIINQPEELISLFQSYAQTEREKEAVRYVLSVEGKIETDPRNAKVFDDLLGRNDGGWYACQRTETFLRVPSNKQNRGKHDYSDSHGRKFWAREFGKGNEVIGVVYVPKGGIMTIVPKTNDLLDVWDPITGLPRVTLDYTNEPKNRNSHTTHFYFNPTPVKESASEYYDVIVTHSCHRSLDALRSCLRIETHNRHRGGFLDEGFRPVLGHMPKIELSRA